MLGEGAVLAGAVVFLAVVDVELLEGLLLPVEFDEGVFVGAVVEEASLRYFYGGGGVGVTDFCVGGPSEVGVFF